MNLNYPFAIQKKSGINKIIAELAKAGSVEEPSSILEIGGGKELRPFMAPIVRRKHLEVANIDSCDDPCGDHVLSLDLDSLEEKGFDHPEVAEFLQSLNLGGIVISHVACYLRKEAMASILRSSVQRVLEDGVPLVVIDKSAWQVDYFKNKNKGDVEEGLALIREVAEGDQDLKLLKKSYLPIASKGSFLKHYSGIDKQTSLRRSITNGKLKYRVQESKRIKIYEDKDVAPEFIEMTGKITMHDLAQRCYILTRNKEL